MNSICSFYFYKLKSVLSYCTVTFGRFSIEIDGKEITKIFIHIILHWEKIINSETRFLQRFIMVNIDILCRLESHAFEIIPVTLSLVKHAYKEVPGKGDLTS